MTHNSRYLVKPLEKERLNKAVSKALLYKKMLSTETHKNTIEGSDKDFLFIKANRRHYKVHFDDIQKAMDKSVEDKANIVKAVIKM